MTMASGPNESATGIEALERRWTQEERWGGIRRDYTAEDVIRLRGSVQVEHSLARTGADRLRELLLMDGFVRTFGALTGAQAVQMVRAGLQAIYVSGWQVAGDQNLSGETYPDMSLYPSNSVPALVRWPRISPAIRPWSWKRIAWEIA
jgi:isocitrate lyase